MITLHHLSEMFTLRSGHLGVGRHYLVHNRGVGHHRRHLLKELGIVHHALQL
jgi:hypothetical protein